MSTLEQDFESLQNGFMKPQIFFGGYFEIETTIGTEIVTACDIGCMHDIANEAFLEFLEGELLDVDGVAEYREGYLARMSANGYLDCTSWTVHNTFEKAKFHLVEMYGDE